MTKYDTTINIRKEGSAEEEEERGEEEEKGRGEEEEEEEEKEGGQKVYLDLGGLLVAGDV